jgi:ATPase family AAA domain-containing protein 3A/B
MRSQFATDQEKELARKEIERLNMEKGQKHNKLGKIFENFAKNYVELTNKASNLFVDSIGKALNANIERQQAVEVARAQAEAQGRALVQRVEKVLEFIKDKPYLIVGIAAGIFGSYFVLKHGTQYIADTYRIPTLAQETSLIPNRIKFKNWLFDVQVESDLTEVKLTEELTEQLSGSALGLKRMVANESILQNKLFYGPPGTGKTEFARRLARYSGMDYIYFSASALEKFSIEEATKQVAELFTYAENSSVPLMIIVDESELVFASRTKLFTEGSNSQLNEKRLAINNQFLTYLSKGSKNYMVIAITNYPDQLDDAFLNRCDEKIFFDAPDAELRRQILDLYIDKYLIHGKHLPLDKKGMVNRLVKLLSVAQPPKKVAIEEETLSADARAEIALKFDKWVGRDIEQFVVALETAARATEQCTITPDVVQRVLNRKIAERKQLDKGSYFMHKKAA